jgi:hypothetical protein
VDVGLLGQFLAPVGGDLLGNVEMGDHRSLMA